MESWFTEPKIPLGRWVKIGITWLQDNAAGFFDAVTALIDFLVDGFTAIFLHIPFPSSELFATLANREEMLEGMLGADLIGFHAQSYMRHFAYTLVRLLGVDLEEDSVHWEGRCIRLGVFPMGVDARALAARAVAADVAENVEDLRADSPGKLLVGIDRLDYTKGIPRRLLAFEELLRHKPEWHGRVRLLQVAVPSRTGVRPRDVSNSMFALSCFSTALTSCSVGKPTAWNGFCALSASATTPFSI